MRSSIFPADYRHRKCALYGAANSITTTSTGVAPVHITLEHFPWAQLL